MALPCVLDCPWMFRFNLREMFGSSEHCSEICINWPSTCFVATLNCPIQLCSFILIATCMGSSFLADIYYWAGSVTPEIMSTHRYNTVESNCAHPWHISKFPDNSVTFQLKQNSLIFKKVGTLLHLLFCQSVHALPLQVSVRACAATTGVSPCMRCHYR